MSSPLPFQPNHGVNAADNYSRLDPGEVFVSRNVLYQKRWAESRPGLSTLALTGIVGTVVFAEQVVTNAGSVNLFLSNAGRIWKSYPVTEITGAGTTLQLAVNNNACSALGLVLIGNNTGGIIVWDPATSVYTVTTDSSYRYVVGHQGRAVAAYANSGGTPFINARTFAWCRPGVLTDWTPDPNGSVGKEAIAEINDEITGLGVLHNIVVILRSHGIHLAYPTGQLPLPYRVEAFILKGQGCFYPSTAAWTDEIVGMVGEDDVYLFDLQNLEPIGYKIRDLLFPFLTNGTRYRGFFTRYGFNNEIRYRYNLFPIANAAAPHFTYDLIDRSWSTHYYAGAFQWAWNALQAFQSLDNGPSFVSSATPPILSYWDSTKPCEQISSFSYFQAGLDPMMDYQVKDLLLRNKDLGANTITAQISASNPDFTTTVESVTRPVGSLNTGRFVRNWMSRGLATLQMSGNEFVVSIQSPANQQMVIDSAVLVVEAQGEYRGN